MFEKIEEVFIFLADHKNIVLNYNILL
jgi:hypothetical protein